MCAGEGRVRADLGGRRHSRPLNYSSVWLCPSTPCTRPRSTRRTGGGCSLPCGASTSWCPRASVGGRGASRAVHRSHDAPPGHRLLRVCRAVGRGTPGTPGLRRRHLVPRTRPRDRARPHAVPHIFPHRPRARTPSRRASYDDFCLVGGVNKSVTTRRSRHFTRSPSPSTVAPPCSHPAVAAMDAPIIAGASS